MITDQPLTHSQNCVGKKVRRVAWQKLDSIVGARMPERFATGSWDEHIPNENEVVLWRISEEQVDQENLDEESGDPHFRFLPSVALPVDSDVMDMQFLNGDQIVFATAKGTHSITRYNQIHRELRTVKTTSNLHDGVACVGFTIRGSDLVSVGESGSLVRLDLHDLKQASATKMDANQSVGYLLCIDHVGTHEVITGSAVGQLQLWDLRQRSGKAICKRLGAEMRQSVPSGGVTSVRSHPSQSHVIASGYQSGILAFWDLRSANSPASIVSAHHGPVWDVRFHTSYPNNVFTCSNDGTLLHWDASSTRLVGDSLHASPWLFDEALQSQVNISSLLPSNCLPVNSVAIADKSLLVGVDDESVWLINNMTLC